MLAITATGGSLVLATHDPDVADRCDRVLDLSRPRPEPPGGAPAPPGPERDRRHI